MKNTLLFILCIFFLQSCDGPVSVAPRTEHRVKSQTLYDYEYGNPVAYFTLHQDYDSFDYYETKTRLTIRNVSGYRVTFNFKMYIDGPGYNRNYTDSVFNLPVGSTLELGIISQDNFNLDECQVSIVSPDAIDYNVPFPHSNG